jgi:hypothetical protein
MDVRVCIVTLAMSISVFLSGSCTPKFGCYRYRCKRCANFIGENIFFLV